MALEYGKIVGTNTVLFETWNNQGGYEFKPVYRDTKNNGANGGFAIKLNTPPLNFSCSGIILESSYANLKAMEGETVTLTAHNLSGSLSVKIKVVDKVDKGYNISESASVNVVTTTYTKRMVQVLFIRES